MDDFDGSLGAIFTCPLCSGAAPSSASIQGPLPPLVKSLRISVNLSCEAVLRCHACGFAGTAADLGGRLTGNWNHFEEALQDHGVFGGEPVPSRWIQRAKTWGNFSYYFDRYKVFYRKLNRYANLAARFGEVGWAEGSSLFSSFPELDFPDRRSNGMFYVELHRSLSGLPLRVAVLTEHGAPVASYRFHEPEAVSVVVPEWALWRDWSQEMILATDPWVATALHEKAAEDPGHHPAIGWVVDAPRAFLDEVPVRKLRYFHSPRESPGFALAFAHGGGRVTTSLWDERANGEGPAAEKEVVAAVADRIVSEQPKGVDPIAYLEAFLDKPWIAPETGRRLTHAVALRLGESAGELIARSGSTSHVLPLVTARATFLARNGIYLKATDRERAKFRPCSNFTLRFLELEGQGDPGHQGAFRLQLVAGGRKAEFRISNRDFHRGTRLLEAATKAAAEARLPVLPVLHDSGDACHLPALVKSTALMMPLPATISGKLGFEQGRFRSVDFTADPIGLVKEQNVSADTRTWIRPALDEGLPLPGNDQLTLMANHLATWISALDKKQAEAAGAVLWATLEWMHRASRGLDSFLLVPSRDHLELMGQLCGLDLIEVGRTMDHPWAPKLLASCFGKVGQFRRHGHLVAAIEIPDRRVDPALPLVVHSMGDTRVPGPPLPVLGLLAYGCLGVSSLQEASLKLSRMAERPGHRTLLGRTLERGQCYRVAPGEHLRAFFVALDRHFGLDRLVIESRGRRLLSRDCIRRLEVEHGYGFRKNRLFAELKEATGMEQPARLGRKQLPVLILPEEPFFSPDHGGAIEAARSMAD